MLSPKALYRLAYALALETGEAGGPPTDEKIAEAMTAVDILDGMGVVAPTPIMAEWGTRFDTVGGIIPGRNAHYPWFFKGDPPRGRSVRRYVTLWTEPDTVEEDTL